MQPSCLQGKVIPIDGEYAPSLHGGHGQSVLLFLLCQALPQRQHMEEQRLRDMGSGDNSGSVWLLHSTRAHRKHYLYHLLGHKQLILPQS